MRAYVHHLYDGKNTPVDCFYSCSLFHSPLLPMPYKVILAKAHLAVKVESAL